MNGDRQGQFTYISDQGCSLIDFIISSPNLFQYVDKFSIYDRLESKHMPLVLQFKCRRSMNTCNSQPLDNNCNAKYKWKLHHESTFLRNISDDRHVLELIIDEISSDIDSAVSKFVDYILKAAECMKITRRRKNKVNKFYGSDCHKAKMEARRGLKRFRKDRNSTNRMNYCTLRNMYKSKCRKWKIISQQNSARKLYDCRKNPKLFWKELRNISYRKKTLPKISDESWFDHFKSLFNSGHIVVEQDAFTSCATPIECESNEVVEQILDSPITQSEIYDAINGLKIGKSPGVDNILAEFIKSSKTFIMPFLAILFNNLFENGTFPDTWSTAIIVPLHKKGDINNPDNYRGISLLSILSKLYTSILNNRITQWATLMDKISETQAGFREGYSTIDHIFTLNALIEKCLCKKRKKLYVAFIDFKKAFDSIDRFKLWNLLSSYGLGGKMMQALKGIYSSVKSCVRCNSHLTDFFDCPYGLKQGCMLSPILFSLFINELSLEIAQNGKHGIQLFPDMFEIMMLLFADDVILVSDTKCGLQSQLNILSLYSDKWGLSVNLDKSDIVVFRRGGRLKNTDEWFFKGMKLNIVNSYKYLGFLFTCNVGLGRSLSDLSLRGKKALLEFKSNLKNIGLVSPDVFFKIFDSQIQSILLYASEMWGYKKYDCIEKIHLSACKYYLSVGSQTPNAIVYGECGRFPIFINSATRCINYWIKLTTMHNGRIPRKAYEMLLNLDNLGYDTWASKIRCLLFSYGFGFVWMSQMVGNRVSFIRTFKTRLVDIFKQGWRSDLDNSSRYVLYREFKSLLNPEKYLFEIVDYKLRKHLVKFRAGLLRLMYNEGRWSKTNINLRICPICNGGIEDEYHFILICPQYEDLRRKYLPTDLTISLFYFNKLLMTNNPHTLKMLCLYIFHSYQRRLHRLGQD